MASTPEKRETKAEEKPAMGLDVAESEFERFAEAMDLDIDPAKMDADDLKGFEKHKRLIIEAMVAGRLVVNTSGEPVYTPTDGKGVLTFPEVVGAHLMAADLRKKDHDVSKMLAVIGEQTGAGITRIAALKQRDLRVVLALGTLFLA